MGGFLETTETLTVKDTYSSYYQQAKITVTVSPAGKVSWKIAMSNDREGSKGRGVYLKATVGSKTIKSAGYTAYDDPNTSKWLTYPTGNGSSKSGSFTLSDNSTEELKISAYICCMQNSTSAGKSGSVTLVRNKWTDGGSCTVIVKDNGNNTATISGALGKSGTNNSIESATLYYTTDGSDPKSSETRQSFKLTATSEGSYSKNVSITKKCTVKAYLKCTFELDSTSDTGSAIVNYYAAPSPPGKPTISYNKSRLTIKEPWKISWAVSTAANAESPVVGYRFRVYKKAAGATSFSTIKFYSKTTGDLLSDDLGGGVDRYYYDRKADKEIPMSFYPDIQGIVPGDTIRFGLYAYTKNGAGTQLFNATQVLSDDYLVQNAGVVHTKVSGVWKEGQVYVKVNGTWQEAETVNVKVNGAWHESE